MNWITILLVSALAMQVFARQSTSHNGLKSKRNSGQRTIRLDPLLRKALLRALTELEREAEEKIKQEEEEKARARDTGKRENDLQESDVDASVEEIQKTADTKYPTAAPIVKEPETEPPPEPTTTTTTAAPEITEPPVPVTVKETFLFQTPTPIEHDFTSPGVQETKKPEATLSPPDIESNLISEPKTKENLIEATDKPEEVTTLRAESEGTTIKPEEEKKDKDTEVELFKAPLVAAFTLHQDSRGTPQSVVPLFRSQVQQQAPRQNFFQPPPQVNLFNRPQQQVRQNLQQQFIPSVTITPFSQPNNFNQPQRNFASTSIPSSTAFPPLVSNSILPNFQSASVVQSQSFELPSTVTPLRNNIKTNNQVFGSTPAPFVSTTSFASTPAPFVSTTAPPRNFSPGSTIKPPAENANDISIVQSHVFNLPSPPSNLVVPTLTPSVFHQFNIPQGTLPLQNEPRIPFSFQQNQGFLDRQKRVEEQNRQRQIEELNRLRFLEGQKRQEQRQRNKAAELRQEGFNQFQQQRPDQGLDFQRSVGFTFEITPKPDINRLPQVNNPFSFNIQQSQSTAFEDIETRNRVNRQEALGSTGNFGFNRQVNQIPQFQKDQRGFQNNQFQQFNTFQQLPQYRTIPDEHYRQLQANRFQQFNRFEPNNFQFRPFQPSPPPVTKQLENLLLQSGVAGGDASRQEDLNIVSKVLALNHERSDTGFPVNRRVSREERTEPETVKGLLVGEISESSTTKKHRALK